MRPQLLRLLADVLCLQEANSKKDENGKPTLGTLGSLIADTPYTAFNIAATKTQGGTPVVADNRWGQNEKISDNTIGPASCRMRLGLWAN
jgi:hypothetical protein